jgi:hypothetical protein
LRLVVLICCSQHDNKCQRLFVRQSIQIFFALARTLFLLEC